MRWLGWILVVSTLAGDVFAYPIDGYPYTGIRRLDFYDLAQQGVVNGRQLSAGAKLGLSDVNLRPIELPGLEAASQNRDYEKQLAGFLGDNKSRYGVAILDLSDPNQPIYAEHNGQYLSNVGSVGKILVVSALLQELASLYPDDITNREALLRETVVTADRFIEFDSHKVPFWDVEKRVLSHRPIQVGDQGSLWEYLDWTLSASSNAAASMVMREVLLIEQFGRDYPVNPERAQEYLDSAQASELRESMLGSLGKVVTAHNIDPEALRQGSFFTRYGKNRVGGVTSYGTPRSLIQLLLLIEQGEFIDEFSSRELKRLLYMTQRRIRYASHPALNDSAVYFKSGSLYSCQPEPDFQCGKYRGNRRNTLASVAIVETQKEGRDLHYAVVVISNVLKVNSAVAHQTLALRIHRMIERYHQETVSPGQK